MPWCYPLRARVLECLRDSMRPHNHQNHVALHCSERITHHSLTHSKLVLGAELSTSTTIVPVIGSEVSITTLHPSGGRATACGKPDAAITWNFTVAICGKTRRGQKSYSQILASVFVNEISACVPRTFGMELCAMRTPSMVGPPSGSA